MQKTESISVVHTNINPQFFVVVVRAECCHFTFCAAMPPAHTCCFPAVVQHPNFLAGMCRGVTPEIIVVNVGAGLVCVTRQHVSTLVSL